MGSRFLSVLPPGTAVDQLTWEFSPQGTILMLFIIFPVVAFMIVALAVYIKAVTSEPVAILP